jgi:hypothetical protein
MHLHVFTIALDAMPWLSSLFVELNRLERPWTWTIVEGVSLPVADTGWMKGRCARLSRDGTHEFLMDLAHHPLITIISKTQWDGKTQMCNAALPDVPCVLLQADADELWTAKQMNGLVELFERDADLSIVKVRMRYFLGPNIVSTSVDGYGNRRTEWMRAWRYAPPMQFNRHEPPVLGNNRGKTMDADETFKHIGAVDHYAWATASQALFKQTIYGDQYADAYQQWMGLQRAETPVPDLQAHLPWVGRGASADTLYK